MKKVVYVVTKVGRDSDFRNKGVGYITDCKIRNDLLS